VGPTFGSSSTFVLGADRRGAGNHRGCCCGGPLPVPGHRCPDLALPALSCARILPLILSHLDLRRVHRRRPHSRMCPLLSSAAVLKPRAAATAGGSRGPVRLVFQGSLRGGQTRRPSRPCGHGVEQRRSASTTRAMGQAAATDQRLKMTQYEGQGYGKGERKS
jgi:hypothetical protein